MTPDEAAALRDVTRSYLAGTIDHTTTATVLAAAAAFGRPGWRAMAELGLPGIGIGEDLGGTDLGLAARLLVHEELGRALYAGPFLGTVAQVVPGLQALGDLKAARGRLELIAAGELTAAAAVPLDGPPGPAATGSAPGPATQAGPAAGAGAAVSVTLTSVGDGWRLDGDVPCVIDAELADGLLVAAVSGAAGSGAAELSMAWVDASAPGVDIEPLATVDLTRRMAKVSFTAAPAELLAGPGQPGADLAAQSLAAQSLAARSLAAVRRGLMLALAAECVGLGARALELTVGYVQARHQFGRPIGSFQAVKHRCAELLITLESARSAILLASTPTQSAHEAAARLAAARICAGDAAFAITNEAIHLHGGIGFTWEYPLHLYYRRAKSNQQLLDSAGGQRTHLAAMVAALYTEREQAS
jgi:alkylation response protein AidB-like acyl-CoA dehydrogenase